MTGELSDLKDKYREVVELLGDAREELKRERKRKRRDRDFYYTGVDKENGIRGMFEVEDDDAEQGKEK